MRDGVKKRNRKSNCFAIRNDENRKFIFALLACLLISACSVAPPPANGWAIVAVNPQTGDVGVAGASCSEYPFDYRAALVPNKGALVQLGVASPLLRDRASAWIEAPMDAPTIVNRISSIADDSDAAKRQWAVVTLQDGNGSSASFSGQDLAPTVGELRDESNAVIVLGSGLANENVLRAARDAFQSDKAMTDKLLRVLEAGSSAGGIALCNQNGVQQTASTAFVIMARGGDSKFQVNTLGNTAAQEPNPPYLALSVTEPIGGKNPLVTLREQYNAWRSTHLPECAGCVTTRVNVPRGGTPVAPGPFQENALWFVSAFVLAVMLLTISYFVLRPRLGRSIHLASEE